MHETGVHDRLPRPGCPTTDPAARAEVMLPEEAQVSIFTAQAVVSA